MINYLEKKVNYLSIILASIFFINLLITSLYKGSNWILSEQIAFAQRLIEEAPSYANGKIDLFFSSSPYFPGVGYLSFIYSFLVSGNIYLNEILMLMTAVLIGFIFFLQIQKLTSKIYPDIPKSVVLTVAIILFATHFYSYSAYMIKFKPDVILLVFGMSALFILERHEKPSVFSIFLVGILLFIGTFFKQSFFLIFILIYLLILFNENLKLKEKFYIFLLYFVVGLSALYFIFQIDNLYYYTVEVMSQHGMHDTPAIVRIFGGSFLLNIVFCLSMAYFFSIRYKSFTLKLFQSKMSLESIYFIFALLWFIFSALSALKIGGNRGNIEVGLIVFTPFVVKALYEIFKPFLQKKYFYYFISTILLIGILGNSIIFFNSSSLYLKKYKNDMASIRYLSNKFKDRIVFIDGDSYIISKASGLKPLTSKETVGHFNNIPEYDLTILKNAIKNRTYDLFFIEHNFPLYKDKEIQMLIKNNYKLYEDKSLPTHLKGKILIPNKK